ncbi:hypothetical protein [Chryseobacterium ginsengisoli]
MLVTITDVENGFQKGMVLKSVDSGLYWEVQERILFSEKEIKFEGETETRIHTNIRNIDKVQNEFDKNIFEYKIKPIGHNEKPEVNDFLVFTVTVAVRIPLEIIDIYEDYLLLKINEDDTGILHKKYINNKIAKIGDYVCHCEHRFHDLVDKNGNFIYR